MTDKQERINGLTNFKKMLEIYRLLHIRVEIPKGEREKFNESDDGKKLKEIETEKGINPALTGQGHSDDNIQKYIEDVCQFDFGRFTVNVQSGRISSYLNIGKANIKYSSKDDKFTISYYKDSESKGEILYGDIRDDNDKCEEFLKQYIEFLYEVRNKDIVDLLKLKKNIILQGAPGTGKTYVVDELIFAICGQKSNNHEDYVKYRKDNEFKIIESEDKKLEYKGNIAFCTFHQSMEYEDFIEGIKPHAKDGSVSYDIEKGLFWHLANAAKKEYEKAKDEAKPYILVIDEINRGNVSKIFGELITLLEAGKRMNQEQSISVKLPYSKEEFELPPNLYIIGTMNTTDRSVGNLDYAVHRRFAFYTMKADADVLGQHYSRINEEELGKTAIAIFNQINGDKGFIYKNRVDPDMDLEDLKVGHSYFLANDKEQLLLKINYEVIPLIKEYIKDGLLKKPNNDSYFDKWGIGETVSSYNESLQTYYIDTIKNPEMLNDASALFEQMYGEDSVLDIEQVDPNDMLKHFKAKDCEGLKKKINKLLENEGELNFKSSVVDPQAYIDAWKELKVVTKDEE